MRVEYRPDIDGLRAVAVVAVVVFHAFPDGLPGGYVGVDIFFVISGFLIASALFRGADTAPFSIREFYARRVRRIFPALSLVLVATLAAGWVLLVPADFKNLGKHVLGGAGFTSNLVLWNEAGYFDSAAEAKPLLHLWSLGVEEQFYIVFPLLLGLLHRFRWNRTLTVTGLIGLSLVFSADLTSRDVTAAFYNPISRIWEILLGVLLADLVSRGKIVDISMNLRNMLSGVGLLLVSAAIATYDNQTLFPGWSALLPTLGATLLILAGPTALVNRFVLSNRLMVGIGLISYPLYLWHWPILVMANIKNGTDTTVPVKMILILMSVCVAYLTFKLVERPLRFRIARKPSIIALTVAMTVAGGAGYLVRASAGFPGRYPVELQDLAEFSPDFATDAFLGSCWLDQFVDPDAFSGDCVGQSTHGTHWLVWGDSHAARFSPGLRRAVADGGEVSQLTRSSCPPILDIEFRECRESNRHAISIIKRDPPDVVLMFGRWETYLKNNSRADITKKLRKTVDALRSVGVVRVILLGPAPFWEGNLPTNLVDLMKKSENDTLPRHTTYRLTSIGSDSDGQLSEISAGIEHLEYFSVMNVLCTDTGCLTTTNGLPSGLTTWDYGHLTTPAAEFVALELLRWSK